MVFYCSANNDLYQVLTEAGQAYPRFESLKEAIVAAEQGSAVLALCDNYPKLGPSLDQELLDLVAAKALRLYIEYPASLPGVELGSPEKARWERLVVTSDLFNPELESLRILNMHGCWYLPTQAEQSHLVLAKVAGYNSAVYRLPETTYPVLFELPHYPVLVATSKLSQFITGRYAPSVAWKAVWEHIFAWLRPEEEQIEVAWTPVVQVTPPDVALPSDAEVKAFDRSIHWFKKNVLFSVDDKKGAIEGLESLIDHNGLQMYRAWLRGDCIAETAMLFAYHWAIDGDPASKLLATQMLDYVWGKDFYHSDPKSPAYGLTNWYERGPIFYGDDNARVLLPTITAARLLDDDRWDERVVTGLLANLRTTGALGFRRPSIWMAHLEKDNQGWQHFRHQELESFRPHFNAYPWACYLLGYALTGYSDFVDRTKDAIRKTVDSFPNWTWTNGLTQEIARMLLPLAFLVRLDDTAEHRDMLKRVVDELLKQMQPCGAIQEQMGAIEYGRYTAPKSNESYGTAEAALIQENGDAASDLLYTVNFAFVGLHEAAVATGDERLKAATDQMADFLCRIQVQSQKAPFVHGAWMRSFDYKLWEYWGSSADLGWGPWCVETGWTNTWIPSVFAMRNISDSLFSTARSEQYTQLLPKVLATMEME